MKSKLHHIIMSNCRDSRSIHDASSRDEVISLIHRFHQAGWVHQSVYERNILVQPPLIDSYASLRNQRVGQWRRNFRLIDFGRSYKKLDDVDYHWEERRTYEEGAVKKLLNIRRPL